MITAAVGIGTGTSTQKHSTSLVFREINPEDEWVVIENIGSSTIDLSGYYMEFELGQEVSQTSEFPEGTTIEPGETLKVASGASEVGDADISFDYDGSVINDDRSDTLAILEPDEQTVVVTSDDDMKTSTEESGPTTTEESRKATTEEPKTTTTEEPEGGETDGGDDSGENDESVDSDGDGLTDEKEAEFGTNPHEANTDGDNWSDGVEVFTCKSDPLDPESP